MIDYTFTLITNFVRSILIVYFITYFFYLGKKKYLFRILFTFPIFMLFSNNNYPYIAYIVLIPILLFMENKKIEFNNIHNTLLFIFIILINISFCQFINTNFSILNKTHWICILEIILQIIYIHLLLKYKEKLYIKLKIEKWKSIIILELILFAATIHFIYFSLMQRITPYILKIYIMIFIILFLLFLHIIHIINNEL